MPKLDRFLKIAVVNRASDLHFSSEQKVRLRVDGDLVSIDEPILSSDEMESLFDEILTDSEKEKLRAGKNLDKSYSLEDYGNFRVNLFWTRLGLSAVLRMIPKDIPSMEELGLPPSVFALTNLNKGLVLVTGPTGSGKSTTLAAMIHSINLQHPYHILTAEDPIEFVHESHKALVNQREIGANCATFADALKFALREDPDVILVGEMRDLETISLALTAAETGHLVFGTLHTRGAGASVDRIIDSFPGNQQAMIRTMLSESLAAVISQTLLKRADGGGRVAAFEILMVNHAVSNLIREGKTFQIPSLMQTGRKDGMVLMDQSILELVQKGVITSAEAAAAMEEPNLLGARLQSKENTLLSTASSSKTLVQVPLSSRPKELEPETFGFDRRLQELEEERPSGAICVPAKKADDLPEEKAPIPPPAPFPKRPAGQSPPVPPPFPRKKIG